jgi:hypothetical protein
MLRRDARSKNWQHFRFFMSDPALPAMDTIFNDVCVLVATAFALTLVPSFKQPERSFLSRRDQGAALLVFTILGLVEEATASNAGLLNERIVAVCAAGLVAGPWVGLAFGVFVTWLAERVSPQEIGTVFAKILGHAVRVEVVPRKTWQALFESQEMLDPLPRIQMLDGFNEGWIDFEGGQASTIKGKVELQTVLQELVDRAG